MLREKRGFKKYSYWKVAGKFILAHQYKCITRIKLIVFAHSVVHWQLRLNEYYTKTLFSPKMHQQYMNINSEFQHLGNTLSI